MMLARKATIEEAKGAPDPRRDPARAGVDRQDSDLLSEVELTTNVIVAAAGYERHLTDQESAT